jgi:acetolactate synthase-1/2/3 large subunit
LNGAQALIQTMVDSDVTVCFANPGTSEMHFVGALDDVPGVRVSLGLFEGVVTGAADGYARVTGKPAATLLHLGPGMANGMANLHNARRARVPMLNIVGDHATFHSRYDAPLNSDIATVARTFSGWVARPETPEELGAVAAEGVAAALAAPYSISTLILPADVSWSDGAAPAPRLVPNQRGTVEEGRVAEIAKLLLSSQRCVVLLGGTAVDEASQTAALRVAAATGCDVLLETSLARLPRGGGLPSISRLSYRAGQAVRQLAGTEQLILVDAKSPVAFFAYPGHRSDLVPDGCSVRVLAGPGDDALAALELLVDVLGAPEPVAGVPVSRPGLPDGELTVEAAADVIAALLPEEAIVVDEGVTSGGYVAAATATGPRHDWLNVTGGAIGIGLPLAIGAAIGAPGRPVVGLQADGSSMYTIQALWTHARERLNTTTVVFNNRQYAILRSELKRVGATEGPKAFDMLDLSRPDLDFVAISQGMGVEAERATTAQDFADALRRALADDGPRLVEAVLPERR